MPFEAGGASAHNFYIDAASLSLGDDGVTRYTLVVRTAGGATNTSFEGIRCEMREVKIYAFGRPDGSWVRARDPRWQRIEYRELNRQHGVLYRDYFCIGKGNPRPVREIIQDLRYPRTPPLL